MNGILYIVSTPIGNLKDITHRAIEVLETADIIAAEDTRRTGRLLKHFEIKNKLIAYHDFNKEEKTPKLISALFKGENIALVSDAGTPGISDPGYYLINRAIENEIQVVPIPGASAILTALVGSGLPTDKFTFLGFFPKKEKKKEKTLEEIKDFSGTTIFYESPHRILKTLDFLSKNIPESRCCVGRELTKKFEEFIRGTVQQVNDNLKERKTIKGEIVLLVSK